MVTKEIARESVNRFLESINTEPGDADLPADPSRRWVINDEFTEEHEFGWVFYFVAEAYLRTKDPMYSAGGNYPIIADRTDGALYFTGPRALQYYLDLFNTNKSQLTRIN